MASAQVLRKQEHLEAGKRRLEEFRRKREQAKKATSTSQNHVSDVRPNEKQPLETDSVRITDLEEAGTSNVPGQPFMGSSASVSDNGSEAIVLPIKTEQDSLNDAVATPLLPVENYSVYPANSLQTKADYHKFKRDSASGLSGSMYVNHSLESEGRDKDFGVYPGLRSGFPYETTTDHSILPRPQSQDFENSTSQSSFRGTDESQSTESGSSLMQSSITNPGYFHVSTAIVSPQDSVGSLSEANPSNASMLISPQTHSSYGDSLQSTTNVRGSGHEAWQYMNGGAHINDSIISNFGERQLGSSVSGLPNVYKGGSPAIETTGFSSDVRSASNHVPLSSVTTETNSRRSRPSFLDSLNVPRASSGTVLQHTEHEESFMSNSTKTNLMYLLGSSPFQKPPVESESRGPPKFKTPNGPSAFDQSINSSVYSSNGGLVRPSINENRVDMKQEFYSKNHNEDFAALEQHIEDLTQEKFSLQRALEASQALANSLAAENSSLTDNYNQQRIAVNQLKSDIENLQEEIKAQLVELDSVKMEYGNAQLECNAADERAKLLASEVIGLEEKALRLRSSELKLERQLENSQAEISSYKKKLSSLEKERQDLQSTIDALQEEKKLLQSKIRKAASSAKPIDFSTSPVNKRDTSTSTEDLGALVDETHLTASSHESDAFSVSLLPENGQPTLEILSSNIPPDQMRMIQNINTIISELALEKEELTQALVSESSDCSKLKELNKELSQGEKNEDLLAVHHPAFYVQTLEVQVYTANPPPDLSGMQSPRLFHTHLPYSALPESIKKSKCKTVYITRNPKDTFVSMWHFFNTRRTPEQGPYPLEDAFESFCNGVFHYGPFFDHVLQYWNQSLKMPHKILFLKYEDLRRNPKDQVKRLASFLGKPFADEEEVEELIRNCSLERLKNLEVNKKGVDPWIDMPYSAYFRKGVVGDWENVLTPEMSQRLDQITSMKLEGSGLDLVQDATTCKKLKGSGLDLEHDATTCVKLERSGLDLVHDAVTIMNLEGSGSDLVHNEITCMKLEARGPGRGPA